MIEISKSTDILINEAIIRKAIEITLASEKVGHSNNKEELEVSVLLTDDAEIQRLNKQYCQLDRPTDVLAFAMREGIDSELNPHLLGDIVISIQTAQRQAVDVGHSLDMELSLLAVHGTLHLLGYDHEIDSEAAIMRDIEEMILRLL
ncbi:rRNA maturation RNase YbeY [Candidatus Poribacteria bacterium]|nr:rRNA maturation RNase YbeY [Candidatus Poribacteria bacterium]